MRRLAHHCLLLLGIWGAATPSVAAWLDDVQVGLTSAAAGLLLDPARARIAPVAPDEPAHLLYHFSPQRAGATWRFRAEVSIGPGAWIAWAIARGDDEWTPVATESWRAGAKEVDFAPFAQPGSVYRVRLTLSGAAGLSRPRWVLDGVEPRPVPGQDLPLGAWWQPAWAALRDNRQAGGRGPGREPEPGPAREELALAGPWERAGEGWRTALWDPRRSRPDATRLLVAAGGAEGGRLALDGAPLVGHRLPHLPLGLVLGDALCPPGPPPPVEVSGADPASVRLVSVGPLELRYVRANLEPDARSCRVRVEAVVVNHKPQPVEGNLRATLDHRGDPVSLRGGAAGYRFPPGPSVAVLRLESDTLRRWEPGRPEVYTLLLRVDDQRADSDRASLRLGLKESRWVDGQWWCNSRVLPARPADADPLTTLRAARGTDLVVALGAPVAPALLDEAERLGVAVGIVVPPARGDLLLSEHLLHAGRPPVLGVVAGP